MKAYACRLLCVEVSGEQSNELGSSVHPGSKRDLQIHKDCLLVAGWIFTMAWKWFRTISIDPGRHERKPQVHSINRCLLRTSGAPDSHAMRHGVRSWVQLPEKHLFVHERWMKYFEMCSLVCCCSSQAWIQTKKRFKTYLIIMNIYPFVSSVFLSMSSLKRR